MEKGWKPAWLPAPKTQPWRSGRSQLPLEGKAGLCGARGRLQLQAEVFAGTSAWSHLLEAGRVQRLSREHCLAAPRTWTSQGTQLPLGPDSHLCPGYLTLASSAPCASLYPSTCHSCMGACLLSFLHWCIHSPSSTWGLAICQTMLGAGATKAQLLLSRSSTLGGK